MDLLSINVGDPRLKGADVLICGLCVSEMDPELFGRIAEGKFLLHSCPEKEHVGVLTSKMATIMKISKPESATILTMDGSPHCLQLHHAAQQAKGISDSEVTLEHLVIEHGELHKISDEAVRFSRHLSHIQRMIGERC